MSRTADLIPPLEVFAVAVEAVDVAVTDQNLVAARHALCKAQQQLGRMFPYSRRGYHGAVPSKVIAMLTDRVEWLNDNMYGDTDIADIQAQIDIVRAAVAPLVPEYHPCFTS